MHERLTIVTDDCLVINLLALINKKNVVVWGIKGIKVIFKSGLSERHFWQQAIVNPKV